MWTGILLVVFCFVSGFFTGSYVRNKRVREHIDQVNNWEILKGIEIIGLFLFSIILSYSAYYGSTLSQQFWNFTLGDILSAFVVFMLGVFSWTFTRDTWKISRTEKKEKEQYEIRIKQIDEIRYKLEFVYGPLYTLLNKSELFPNPEVDYTELSGDDKGYLDNIFSRYSYIIKTNIFEYWKVNIQPKQADSVDSDFSNPWYNIPNEFIEFINNEYSELNDGYRILSEN